MNLDYIDGKLIVDEIIIDPGLPSNFIVRIGVDFYMMSNAKTTGKVTEKDLRPYKKQTNKTWYRPTSPHNFWIHGLVPRGGYQVDIGRAATEAEFSEVVLKYGLTEDDVSNEFTDSRGGLYGEEFKKSFPARQIRLKTTGEALEIERELRSKGIEASNGSPDRVNIRVEQSGKQ